MLKDILTDPKLGIGADFKFGKDTQLGDVLTKALELVVFLAAFLAFFWFVWGAFHYIFSGGNKEELSKAKKRMTWAIVGLILVLLAYVIAQFAGQILQPKPGYVLPGFSLIPTAYAAVDIGDQFGFGDVKSLGQGTSRLVLPAFSIATVAVVIYFLIGAFKYLVSGGDKEQVTSARAMITHAIIGFILLMLAFFVIPFTLSRLFGITTFQIIPIP